MHSCYCHSKGPGQYWQWHRCLVVVETHRRGLISFSHLFARITWRLLGTMSLSAPVARHLLGIPHQVGIPPFRASAHLMDRSLVLAVRATGDTVHTIVVRAIWSDGCVTPPATECKACHSSRCDFGRLAVGTALLPPTQPRRLPRYVGDSNVVVVSSGGGNTSNPPAPPEVTAWAVSETAAVVTWESPGGTYFSVQRMKGIHLEQCGAVGQHAACRSQSYLPCFGGAGGD